MATPSSDAALEHLKRIKPTDGWSVQTSSSGAGGLGGSGGGRGVRLCRRTIPLTDNAFLDIHYDDATGQVVGVMTEDGSTCQVLIDRSGRPLPRQEKKIISSSSSYPVAATNNRQRQQQRGRSTTPSTTTTTNNNNRTATAPGGGTGGAGLDGVISAIGDMFGNLTPEERQVVEMYLKYVLVGIVALIMIRALAMSSVVFVVIFPLLYLYGITTCPPMASFDAKKELKRVMRGHHLPQDHPDNPTNKSMFEQWTTRIAASVTAELATFPGYEIEMTPLGGAAIWTEVKVPTANLLAYWLGANHRWYYIGSREIEPRQRRPHQD